MRRSYGVAAHDPVGAEEGNAGAVGRGHVRGGDRTRRAGPEREHEGQRGKGEPFVSQIHALLLLVLALWRRQTNARVLVHAGRGALLGVLLFSGSLYLMALTGVRALGAVTPLGGVCFLFAWGAVVVAAGRAVGPQPA